MTGIVIAPPTTFKPVVATSPVMAGGGKYRLGGGDPQTLGFETVTPGNKKTALFLVITGKTGTGKNRLAYSAAEEGKPVLEIAIVEKGSEGDDATSEYTKTGLVKRKLFIVDDKDPLNQLQAKRIFEEFQKTVFALYGFDGTLVINSIDEIYEIGRMAIYETLEKVMRRDYGPINRAMNDILSYFARTDSRTNLILLSKGVDLWVGGENTGRTGYKGYPNAEFLCDTLVSLDKEVYVVPSDKKAKDIVFLENEKKFSCTIFKSTADSSQEGKELKGKEITFANIKKLTLPSV